MSFWTWNLIVSLIGFVALAIAQLSPTPTPTPKSISSTALPVVTPLPSTPFVTHIPLQTLILPVSGASAFWNSDVASFASLVDLAQSVLEAGLTPSTNSVPPLATFVSTAPMAPTYTMNLSICVSYPGATSQAIPFTFARMDLELGTVRVRNVVPGAIRGTANLPNSLPITSVGQKIAYIYNPTLSCYMDSSGLCMDSSISEGLTSLECDGTVLQLPMFQSQSSLHANYYSNWVPIREQLRTFSSDLKAFQRTAVTLQNLYATAVSRMRTVDDVEGVESVNAIFSVANVQGNRTILQYLQQSRVSLRNLVDSSIGAGCGGSANVKVQLLDLVNSVLATNPFSSVTNSTTLQSKLSLANLRSMSSAALAWATADRLRTDFTGTASCIVGTTATLLHIAVLRPLFAASRLQRSSSSSDLTTTWNAIQGLDARSFMQSLFLSDLTSLLGRVQSAAAATTNLNILQLQCLSAWISAVSDSLSTVVASNRFSSQMPSRSSLDLWTCVSNAMILASVAVPTANTTSAASNSPSLNFDFSGTRLVSTTTASGVIEQVLSFPITGLATATDPVSIAFYQPTNRGPQPTPISSSGLSAATQAMINAAPSLWNVVQQPNSNDVIIGLNLAAPTDLPGWVDPSSSAPSTPSPIDTANNVTVPLNPKISVTDADLNCPAGYFRRQSLETGDYYCEQCWNGPPLFAYCPGDNYLHLCSTAGGDGTYIAQGLGYANESCPFRCDNPLFYRSSVLTGSSPSGVSRGRPLCLPSPIGLYPLTGEDQLGNCLVPFPARLSSVVAFRTGGSRGNPYSCDTFLFRRSVATATLTDAASRVVSGCLDGLYLNVSLKFNVTGLAQLLSAAGSSPVASQIIAVQNRWSLYLILQPTYWVGQDQRCTMQLVWNCSGQLYFSGNWTASLTGLTDTATAVSLSGGSATLFSLVADANKGTVSFLANNLLLGTPRRWTSVAYFASYCTTLSPSAATTTTSVELGGFHADYQIGVWPPTFYSWEDSWNALPSTFRHLPATLLSLTLRPSLPQPFSVHGGAGATSSELLEEAKLGRTTPPTSSSGLFYFNSTWISLARAALPTSCPWGYYGVFSNGDGSSASCTQCPSGTVGSTGDRNQILDCQCLSTRTRNNVDGSCQSLTSPFAAPTVVGPSGDVTLANAVVAQVSVSSSQFPLDGPFDTAKIEATVTCSDPQTNITFVPTQFLFGRVELRSILRPGGDTCSVSVRIVQPGRTPSASVVLSAAVWPSALPLNPSAIVPANGSSLMLPRVPTGNGTLAALPLTVFVNSYLLNEFVLSPRRDGEPGFDQLVRAALQSASLFYVVGAVDVLLLGSARATTADGAVLLYPTDCPSGNCVITMGVFCPGYTKPSQLLTLRFTAAWIDYPNGLQAGAGGASSPVTANTTAPAESSNVSNAVTVLSHPAFLAFSILFFLAVLIFIAFRAHQSWIRAKKTREKVDEHEVANPCHQRTELIEMRSLHGDEDSNSYGNSGHQYEEHYMEGHGSRLRIGPPQPSQFPQEEHVGAEGEQYLYEDEEVEDDRAAVTINASRLGPSPFNSRLQIGNDYREGSVPRASSIRSLTPMSRTRSPSRPLQADSTFRASNRSPSPSHSVTVPAQPAPYRYSAFIPEEIDRTSMDSRTIPPPQLSRMGRSGSVSRLNESFASAKGQNVAPSPRRQGTYAHPASVDGSGCLGNRQHLRPRDQSVDRLRQGMSATAFQASHGIDSFSEPRGTPQKKIRSPVSPVLNRSVMPSPSRTSSPNHSGRLRAAPEQPFPSTRLGSSSPSFRQRSEQGFG